MTDAHGTFGVGAERWLDRLDNLRNVVRQEMVSRQLAAHLPAGGRVLDVGAGQGTQAIRLATAGFEVTAVEPAARMREVMARNLESADPAARARTTIVAGEVGRLGELVLPGSFDVVLCHGVLMYLPESVPVVAELAEMVSEDGIVSIVQRNGDAMAWRPAVRADWGATIAMLDEVEPAKAARRSPRYRNEIGSDTRADTVADLHEYCVRAGLVVEGWYGIRVATDNADVEQKPPVADELDRLLDAEERLGATDPYRWVATLQHVIARRASMQPPSHR